MKLLSLNLQGFEAWEKRKSAILDYLQQESPDVLLFQEVVFLPNHTPYNQVQLLNQELRGYTFEHSAITRLQVGINDPVYREGLASLSRFPVTKTEAIILKQAEGDEHNRIIQLLDILVDGQLVKIAHVHFSLTDITDFATAHLLETLDILKSRHEKRIIMGDFNLRDELASTRAAWENDYIASTSFDYVSFIPWNDRTDYVLLPKEYSFKTFSTSPDGLSDHRAIVANIERG